ncbi:DUF2851 family protein [Chitinophaga nivalis]|uniref:DUF2851 family protein n=1 Tax=Chitinophaga nivalis TaxID=2991709 RepID=A0ABT3IRT7_9BACT|nr:DUF2851 family protein [Chitinophaga nivalis]MCW3463651.1 DUF2851 family protein [Chitinophaga nivalis]MCW3486659.1 DUF2851 family protein [Chitinophaga nivalis]
MRVNPPLTEELFQHIWEFRLFQQEHLFTTDGEPVQIIYPGLHNHHDGPDFTGAKIRISHTLWVGHVELHLRTSDWFRHRHDQQQQYQRIILHVVFRHDMPGREAVNAPCLELQQYIPKLLLHRYEVLRRSAAFIPCAGRAAQVPLLTWLSWKERMLAERWERKMNALRAWLLLNKYNWEEVCYWAVAQSFGMPVNALPFLQVAQSLPYPVLMRYRHQSLHIEALLFGQAGMLEEDFADVYALQLQHEFMHLQHKYRLLPMAGHLWNWLRLRPAAFPTIRLATFGALLQQTSHLFSRILEAPDVTTLEQLFLVQPSAYWHTHYRFGHTVDKTLRPGRQAVYGILINTVLPLLFLYGQQQNLKYYQEKALHFLQQLPAENNKITKGWRQLGVHQENALESQALLQLKQYYCDEKRCLQCAIGAKIISGRN